MILLLIAFTLCAVTLHAAAFDERILRVSILSIYNLSAIELRNQELLAATADGETALSGNLSLSASGNRVLLLRSNEPLLDAPWIALRPAHDTIGLSLLLPGGATRDYPGTIRAEASAGVLRLINLVAAEDYLAGVVTAERGGPPLAGYDRLLAVLARGQAVANDKTFPGYDLIDLTTCQVYAGRGDAAAYDAVRHTHDLVPILNDHALAVPFSACCGGSTADVSQVWSSDETPSTWLSGIKDLDSQGRAWCRSHPRFRWSANLPPTHWQAARDCALPDARGLGRTRDNQICFESNRGPTCTTKERFRICYGRLYGWNVLLSNDFDSEPRPDGSLLISGRGFGHRLGVCQVGARARIEAGQDPFEVLRTYCPGVRVAPLRSSTPDSTR
ncbi:MAG: SpoIID/LytB domain-containing protein [Candidatus Alcyoniella australis]|nr:SpoIID/LytB domain-containing protein [Candidatus Alcyoniella australis]